MTVDRFCARLGIPRSTWYSWRAGHLGGREVKRWPAPIVDDIEEPAATHAGVWSAWGHRKIWAMLRSDGVTVSQSSVYRALKRRDLLQPARYQAERRAMADARKKAFVEPPKRRNRVWQTDFTQLEVTSVQSWWIAPVTDYFAKVVLAAPVTNRTASRDAINALKEAIVNAKALLGHSLLVDCTDPMTGEITPVIIVTDNGPSYKSLDFARFIASHPELTNVRTRHYSPQTNGVVERFNQSLKYEHLYRIEIPNSQDLVDEIETYRDIYNRIRPHESLGWFPPVETYLAPPG
ncbi:MAG: Transposase InsO family protein [Acidimicrobiaceae bacterium]|nr:Transposase InsO family protein [Acidimicrobiaceae bacterium]